MRRLGWGWLLAAGAGGALLLIALSREAAQGVEARRALASAPRAVATRVAQEPTLPGSRLAAVRPLPDTPQAPPPADCEPAAGDEARHDSPERSAAEQADDDALRRQLDAALASRGSERAAAARHFIVMVVAGADSATEQAQAGVDCSEVSCWREIDAAQAAPRFALARLALRSADPAVYAAAFQACGLKREQDCQMISARQWARIDQQNAVPWLHLAEDAAARNDESGVAEALYQIGRANRSENYAGTVVREALTALPLPAAQDPLARLLTGVQMSWQQPPVGTLARHCGVAGVTDANRLQVCGEQSIGLLIGRRTGWSAERIAAAENERDAARYLIKQRADFESSASACEVGRVAGRDARVFAERGEVGVVREAMRTSGQSVAQLAAAYRAAREPQQAAERSGRAASAARAAPP